MQVPKEDRHRDAVSPALPRNTISGVQPDEAASREQRAAAAVTVRK